MLTPLGETPWLLRGPFAERLSLSSKSAHAMITSEATRIFTSTSEAIRTFMG